MITFTIAVMIYNVGKFLPMCIESIMVQEGQDIEILLIDDGSTDESGLICDRYSKMDSRIRVIHQKNRGVAASRNVAIENAQGKWLIQVDGDDVLLEHAVEYGRKYIDDVCDWLQFDTVVFQNTVTENLWNPKGPEMIISGNNRKEFHLQLIDRTNPSLKYPTYNLNPAWGKIWNLNFIQKYKLRYDENIVKGEGTLFTFTASYVMNKVKIIPLPIYGYRINLESTMHRFSPDILKHQTEQISAYRKVVALNNDNSNDIEIALIKRGLYLIENAVHLSIAHVKCSWSVVQQYQWIKSLCALEWVKKSVKYGCSIDSKNKIYEYIYKNDYISIFVYSAYLRIKKKLKNIMNK